MMNAVSGSRILVSNSYRQLSRINAMPEWSTRRFSVVTLKWMYGYGMMIARMLKINDTHCHHLFNIEVSNLLGPRRADSEDRTFVRGLKWH
jgi:hypothetical protein